VNIAARLEAGAPTGGILISRAVRDAVEGRLKVSFDSLGELALKNIDRPIEAFRVSWDAADWESPAAEAAGASPAMAPATDLPDKPSIAVLPFQNMSGDPEQEYFADGMVEDVISALSRFKSLFVIARNSSFTYKGRAIDIKQVGRELGVRYVLEGSVRKAGNRVRITGQLIEAASGAHLWADRFESPLEDVFELQDRITTSVVGELGAQLQFAEMERARRKATSDLTAYDHYLRGMERFYAWRRETTQEALGFFLKAIDLDPNYAVAHALAALCYTLRKQSRWTEDPAWENAEGVRLARRALELGDRDDSWVLGTAGFALAYLAEELEYGAECIAESLALNPNYAFGWTFSGWVQIYLGEPETALTHLAQARRLSPRDPGVLQLTTGMALAHFFAGRYEETVRLAEQVARQVPTFLPAWRMTAIGYAMAGQQDRAAAAAARVTALDPAARVAILVPLLPLRRSEDRERYRQGLLSAGLPG
jgi:TolB-like protein